MNILVNLRKPAIRFLLLIFILLINSCGEHERQDMKPNFLFILVDDLGWTDLGCYGSEFYETPNIDGFSKTAMKFTQAYAACPVCSPTRASIMTGKYPARLNTTDWFGAPQPDNVDDHWTRNKPLLPAPYVDHMPLEEYTIAEALREAGYRTFFAGKWHLGGPGFYPEDQGFDINVGGWEKGGPWGGDHYFSPYGNPKLSDGPQGEHLPDRLAVETSHFIIQSQNEPFFAYLSFYSVHTPLMGRKDLVEKYEAKLASRTYSGETFIPFHNNQWRQIQDHTVYAAMVEAMDRAVGKVLHTLDSLKLAERTIVFLMSDNGGLSTSEGHPTTNLPLKAGKGWLYEGGVREPMIIKWPGIIPKDSHCTYPVTSTDFYPTILEMADIPLLPGQHMDGRSLVPLLKGEKDIDRNELYWHYPHYGNQGGSPGSAIRKGDYKLIEFFEDGHLELYHIPSDIGENLDLSDVYPGIADSLHRKLKRWREQVYARYPTQNPKSTIE